MDDDSIVRSLIARILEEAGYEVETAPDALEALGTVSSAARDFDLVITDVRMPAMDGWELGRRIQYSHPMLPVLPQLYGQPTDLRRNVTNAVMFSGSGSRKRGGDWIGGVYGRIRDTSSD